MLPVTIADTEPIAALAVFMMLPTVAPPPRGATSEGNDQPMVDAVVSALTETVIQNSTQKMSVVKATQTTARPRRRQVMIVDLRTSVSSCPRLTSQSTNQPPITNCAMVAMN